VKTLRDMVAIVCLVVVTVGVMRVLNDTSRALRSLEKTEQKATATLAAVDQVAARTADVVDALRQASKTETDSWDRTIYETQRTAHAVRGLIDYTNKSLNEPDKGLFAVAKVSLDRLTFNGDQLTDSTTRMLGDYDKAAVSLNQQLDNPDISLSLHHLSIASLHLAETSDHLDKTTAAAEHTVEYYDRRLTAPVGFAKRVGMAVISAGSTAGSIMGGLLK
jgi:type II secretory pathway component PulJ